ncbi:malate synthase [Virgibacillus natechei]|uniref:Malate synthase n=1 Tax=Virgibacillus natechei TaxID=1216297 RepID=A0ABS4IEV4_9BACI|nr:malate synthase A [Virgibacillus natechei]MBP1969484.1 malate synthase [Virgibacillus natechei]UZD11811.1 malate synthase A [Virgibacillus natechei]
MLIKNSNVQVKNQEKFAEVLTPEALEFLQKLHNNFDERRRTLLKMRNQTQEQFNKGQKPDFLPETKTIREGNWEVAPLPKDLQDRRVEITGPVDRKMIINALNSGAKGFMADFEDATSPTWENVMNGQLNLQDAVRRKIDFQGENGKFYSLNQETAVLMVRPRGWHLTEKNITVDGESISGSFVDFGLYLFHNAQELLKQGTGPYFYLPKLENHLEARLWNDIFIFSQNELGISQGTIKATVLIETITAAFEMDEILYELREHSAGLNCGRWDYIFSYIKKFQNDPAIILPDRSVVTMEVPFMRAYSLLAIQTCHKRNSPAIGGMAAQIPVKNDEKANQAAFEKVRVDKEREVRDGHDGTWVAHPGMVKFVKAIFDKGMPEPNQIAKTYEARTITQADLLEVPNGAITEKGLRMNINVGIQYITYWLSGHGAAPINNLMEDAATAEISRAQVWQWIRHPKGVLEDGRNVTFELVDQLLEEELQFILKDSNEGFSLNYRQAAEIFDELIKQDDFVEFLTLPAYRKLLKGGMKYE